MRFKIVHKPSFTLIGYMKRFNVNDGYKECPLFWKEHFELGRNEYIRGAYAVCVNDDPKRKTFSYIIADTFFIKKEYPKETKTIVFSEGLWAIFPIKGPIPYSLQKVNEEIYRDWLINNNQYRLRENVDIEMYTDPLIYKNGEKDRNYYSEIWIPVTKIS